MCIDMDNFNYCGLYYMLCLEYLYFRKYFINGLNYMCIFFNVEYF